MKLLIVEDNPSMRAMIRLVAAQADDEVRECANGSEAFAAYARFQPDWVTMDLGLPGLDGLAATRQIIDRFPGARVVIVTSHDSGSLRKAARESGASDYVLKERLERVREIFSTFIIPVKPPPYL